MSCQSVLRLYPTGGGARCQTELLGLLCSNYDASDDHSIERSRASLPSRMKKTTPFHSGGRPYASFARNLHNAVRRKSHNISISLELLCSLEEKRTEARKVPRQQTYERLCNEAPPKSEGRSLDYGSRGEEALQWSNNSSTGSPTKPGKIWGALASGQPGWASGVC
ncbi:hypothetical protein BX600DRAFT_142719 [Xylariales sp. PMI_506]|nr:hypothetical protein BX600DRAFT_142719 [Xylariales sp. PMI_506]